MNVEKAEKMTMNCMDSEEGSHDLFQDFSLNSSAGTMKNQGESVRTACSNRTEFKRNDIVET